MGGDDKLVNLQSIPPARATPRAASCRGGEESLNGFHHSILNVRDCHGNSDGMGIPGEEKGSEGWSRPLREGSIESFRC